MKLLFLTGSRGEWGYIRPILKLCKSRKIRYKICATNMHLLPSYGMTIEEIKSDGFEVSDELYMALDGYNHFTMAKSMGLLLISFLDVIRRIKPDWLVLAGDRGETLMGAIAGAYTYTPIAHIQAGELSGNIDGLARHAIGKFAHIHFASNKDAEDRLLRLGEEPFRVHRVGAPQLDEIYFGASLDFNNLKKLLGINVLPNEYILVVQHPVTEEYDFVNGHIDSTINAVTKMKIPSIWILPNNDAGSLSIKSAILTGRTKNVWIFNNLPRNQFITLLKHAACIAGNSSAGLLEAPSFGIPAVNIGRRQEDRMRGNNVIDVQIFDTQKIVEAIKLAISKEFKQKLINCENPYGDGRSSERILDILSNTEINDKLLVKKLTY